MLFCAFFCSALSIRYFNHVGYMINVPLGMGYRSITAESVARQLNRAGHFYGYGMRAYYFLVPLVLWLFGPHLMVLSTAGVVLAMFKVDYVPPAVAGEPLKLRVVDAPPAKLEAC